MTTPTIPPARLPAAEAVALQTATRNSSSPSGAGDDFGFLRCLPLAIAGGLVCWAITLWWLL